MFDSMVDSVAGSMESLDPGERVLGAELGDKFPQELRPALDAARAKVRDAQFVKEAESKLPKGERLSSKVLVMKLKASDDPEERRLGGIIDAERERMYPKYVFDGPLEESFQQAEEKFYDVFNVGHTARGLAAMAAENRNLVGIRGKIARTARTLNEIAKDFSDMLGRQDLYRKAQSRLQSQIMIDAANSKERGEETTFYEDMLVTIGEANLDAMKVLEISQLYAVIRAEKKGRWSVYDLKIFRDIVSTSRFEGTDQYIARMNTIAARAEKEIARRRNTLERIAKFVPGGSDLLNNPDTYWPPHVFKKAPENPKTEVEKQWYQNDVVIDVLEILGVL